MAEKPEKERIEKQQEAKAEKPSASAEAKSEKKPEKKEGGKRKEPERTSSIIRLAGKDVNGELSLQRALDQVKGIGQSMAHALSHSIETNLGIQRSTQLSTLNEDQIEKIEEVIKNPAKYGIPEFMLNRNKDFETGRNVHVVSNDLLFAGRQDVTRDVSNRTWRGFRHQYGQKVRGQHTRSTGRSGATIGVMKKSEAAKVMAAAAAPAAGAAAPKAEKKAAAPAEEKK
ncbi:MAG: 30S ribosomal protein S13 [Candidatus Marsarchaeota archaeon]|nr:30S ribosomal protein S13 [Candidatus Marsarchaeota archaeon]